MKNLFYSLMIAAGMVTTVYADATTQPKQPETKRVCITQKDAKTGKDREVCRQVRIHKKLDGTKVPERK